ncbi:unnamed protein product [Arctogadus glacialis]
MERIAARDSVWLHSYILISEDSDLELRQGVFKELFILCVLCLIILSRGPYRSAGEGPAFPSVSRPRTTTCDDTTATVSSPQPAVDNHATPPAAPSLHTQMLSAES